MNQYEIVFKNIIDQITRNHYLRFVSDFSKLLNEQIDRFNVDEFEDWKYKQLHAFELIGKFKTTQEKHQFLINLRYDGYKYDCLFLCKDFVNDDSPILTSINYPLVSMNDITHVIKAIDKTNMVIVDESRLKTFILLYLSQKFTSTFIPKNNL